MNALQTKGNEAKKVPSATETKKTESVKTTAKTDLQIKKEELAKILQPQSAEQRLKNLDLFRKMAEKHRFLQVKSDELNSFLVSRDGLKEKVILLRDDMQPVEISNSVVIEKVLILCADTLTELLEKSEKEILTFEI